MKKVFSILLFMTLLISGCSADDNQTGQPTVEPTKNWLIVDTNISTTQGQLRIYRNGSGNSATNSMIEVEDGDLITIKSDSPAPVGSAYWIKVLIGSEVVVDYYQSPVGERMNYTFKVEL